ncbi:hypothetical protein BD770DRAFT_243021 [Pilaira anomala]|nr:hypothetical protein BD770DRAFT_243021 [Pilaira anomala]
MDLLLILQSKQSNKVTYVAHSAETDFSNRRPPFTEFGKKYQTYWERRKEIVLRQEVNNESYTIISYINRLVNQNIVEKAKNVKDDVN